jgi:hypothetical protein
MDLIRDLSVSNDKVEFLASRLKERNILKSDFNDCHYRIKYIALEKFFRLGGPVVVCHDISGLSKGLKQEYNPSDRRLFIDC